MFNYIITLSLQYYIITGGGILLNLQKISFKVAAVILSSGTSSVVLKHSFTPSKNLEALSRSRVPLVSKNWDGILNVKVSDSSSGSGSCCCGSDS